MNRTLPFLLAASALAGCTDDPVPSPVGGTTSSTSAGGPSYHATVTWTTEGIPHVTAEDPGSLGFGLGYAAARDIVCVLADQIVKVRSERSKYFGPGPDDANVGSDFAYAALRVRADAADALAKIDTEGQAAIAGYAAGYDQWLAEVGPAGLPAPCTDADWVKPITAEDLVAYYTDLNLIASAQPFLDLIVAAQPPATRAGSGTATSAAGAAPRWQPKRTARSPWFPRRDDIGSNGWAVGRDRTETGRGMLVANPHFPWTGELRLFESHLTIPGEIDVYGAALTGVPFVLIGFTKDVAWTHTVTPAHHFTVYRLPLVEGDPTKYTVDGVEHAMTSETYAVEIKEGDGSLRTESRTFWRSHHGPMVATPGLDWTKKVAYTFRDANADNPGFGSQWLALARAQNVDGIEAALETVHGIPWVFTIATDKDGEALVMDASRVPNLSQEAEDAYLASLETDVIAKVVLDNGAVLLDGSTSANDWVDEDGATDGLVPGSKAPRVRRTDYALNANDPIWLANAHAPLTGYPWLYGAALSVPSPRTRLNLLNLEEEGPDAPTGADHKFSADELRTAILENRGMLAVQLRDAVVERCTGVASVDDEGTLLPLGPACDALADWDGRLDLDSPGALVWREFLGGFGYGDVVDQGALYAVPFDPADPVLTPNTLVAPPAEGADPVLVRLGRALARLESVGFDATTTLRDAQYTLKGDERLPVHGGSFLEGTTNYIGFSSTNTTLLPKLEQAEVVNGATFLTTEGYLVNYGTSFIMGLAFTDDGPQAKAFLTYSQSNDPASPHFADQTRLYAEKAWRECRFTTESLAADAGRTTQEVTSAP